MYLHVGPFTPYFVYGYEGIRNVLTMWLAISNPLSNPITPANPISKIAQTGIVINGREPLDEYEDNFEGKHNPRMP
jgi:hypothetical protein